MTAGPSLTQSRHSVSRDGVLSAGTWQSFKQSLTLQPTDSVKILLAVADLLVSCLVLMASASGSRSSHEPTHDARFRGKPNGTAG
jgi:hypothetical protein